ncbi:thioredoxin family protein [Alkalihalobacillus pseudalcaliphilus]|uniref:thioredoxin family protein n=1 Tax=Alkalihalobacillus pseudalcaliphilus TaxID=79884 RepID=UPI00064D8432|nr:thioredoxin family protein [Alkalihalobacillus pseudalcaliphilus]KMK76392.1 thioredoxin [Alkalihalobacillus pseudalcaliphilus]
MQETNVENLQSKLNSRNSVEFLYVYTPLCGTCKLAKKMVEVIEATDESLIIHQLNINHAPDFAKKWKIESVPALFVFQNGLGVERIYAFQSVPFLFETLQPYLVKNRLNQNKDKGDN